jgi:hypothetical protein
VGYSLKLVELTVFRDGQPMAPTWEELEMLRSTGAQAESILHDRFGDWITELLDVWRWACMVGEHVCVQLEDFEGAAYRLHADPEHTTEVIHLKTFEWDRPSWLEPDAQPPRTIRSVLSVGSAAVGAMRSFIDLWEHDPQGRHDGWEVQLVDCDVDAEPLRSDRREVHAFATSHNIDPEHNYAAFEEAFKLAWRYYARGRCAHAELNAFQDHDLRWFLAFKWAEVEHDSMTLRSLAELMLDAPTSVSRLSIDEVRRLIVEELHDGDVPATVAAMRVFLSE